VQDQPVVGVAAERRRDDPFQLRLDRVDGLAGREAGAVGNAEDMGVDRERLFAPGSVEHDIGGLAADSGERFELLAVARHRAAMIADQRFGQRDDVLRLGVEEADRLDRNAQRILAELQQLFGLGNPRE
jgi:hypothetical protein